MKPYDANADTAKMECQRKKNKKFKKRHAGMPYALFSAMNFTSLITMQFNCIKCVYRFVFVSDVA